MDFVCKLYSNTYAVHVTVALVGVATLNLALPAPLSENFRVPTVYRDSRKQGAGNDCLNLNFRQNFP